MSEKKPEEQNYITSEMTVLDVVSRYRPAETVFKRYDEKAGECICCHSLFEFLKDIAKKYKLNLKTLMADLETIARHAEKNLDPLGTLIETSEILRGCKPEK